MNNKKYSWLTAVMLGLLLFALAACGPAEPSPTTEEEGEAAAETTGETEETAMEDTAVEAEATDAPAEEPAQPDTGAAPATDAEAEINILEEGDGPAPQAGEIVTLNYTVSLEDGTVIDSSDQAGQPVQFILGQGMVLPAIDEGVSQMNQGGVVQIVIPPALAYGEQGVPGVIPPNSTITFEMELLEIAAAPPPPPESPTEVSEGDLTTTDSGLQYAELAAGDGEVAEAGDTVSVHYTGWLEDGTQFDSSLSRGLPFEFTLGAGQVIPGWDEGVAGMAIGESRQLIIPAELGYGEAGSGGVIPPNATLIFEVELLDVLTADQ